MLNAAEDMDAKISATTTSVRSMREKPVGTVRIACVQTAVHLLRSFANEITAASPGLAIEVISSMASADLAKGEADIAIRTIAPTDPGLVIAHTFTWGSCLYASKVYLSSFGRPRSHEELSNHRFVLCGASLLKTRAFGWIEQFTHPDQPKTRVENSDSARTIIEQGDGIGQLFCLVGDACQSLERVFPDPFDQMESWVLYHETARGSANVRAVLDALVPYLRERRALLSGM